MSLSPLSDCTSLVSTVSGPQDVNDSQSVPSSRLSAMSDMSPRSIVVTPMTASVSKGLADGQADHDDFHLRMTLETGYFHSDDVDGVNNAKLGTVFKFPKNFGLKSRPYATDATIDPELKHPTDWQRFDHMLREMNKVGANDNTQYVLLYLARHGQGYHNVAEERTGTYLWENESSFSKTPLCYLDQFRDARLTPVGIKQADLMSDTLSKLIQDFAMPPPQAYYVSPLHRACSTAQRTWSPLAANGALPADRPFKPIVHELLREQMYNHNCNQRSTLSEVHTNFCSSLLTSSCSSTATTTNFTIEPDSHGPFTEQDELWCPSNREQDPQVTERAYLALSDILKPNFLTTPAPSVAPLPDRQQELKPHQYISITSHAGFMSGLYRALNQPQSSIPRFPTGIMIPLLIKVQKIPGPRPPPPPEFNYRDMKQRVQVVREQQTIATTRDARDLNPGHTSAGKQHLLRGKDLQTVLDEIFDPAAYDAVWEDMKRGKWT